MFTQKNGKARPVVRATAEPRFSNSPAKEKDMNKQIDTTDAKSVAIVSAMKGMEYDFHAISMMAEIMADMLDDMVSSDNTDRIESGYCCLKIHSSEMDRACFAWNDVLTRAKRLETKFFDALYPAEVRS